MARTSALGTAQEPVGSGGPGIPGGHGGKLTLLAVGVGLLATGCSLAPGLSPSSPSQRTPGVAARPKSHVTTALTVSIGSLPLVYQLSTKDAIVSCGIGDHSVVVKGSVQGTAVTVRITGVHRHQQLDVPPAVGSLHDSVTVNTAGGDQGQPLTYVVGYTDGAYQGVGTIGVGKVGNSGTVAVTAAAPQGQEPSPSFIGANAMFLGGTWRCP